MAKLRRSLTESGKIGISIGQMAKLRLGAVIVAGMIKPLKLSPPYVPITILIKVWLGQNLCATSFPGHITQLVVPNFTKML